jgi:sulfopyruvate decarboxylase TPP-binding subunit
MQTIEIERVTIKDPKEAREIINYATSGFYLASYLSDNIGDFIKVDIENNHVLFICPTTVFNKIKKIAKEVEEDPSIQKQLDRLKDIETWPNINENSKSSTSNVDTKQNAKIKKNKVVHGFK